MSAFTHSNEFVSRTMKRVRLFQFFDFLKKEDALLRTMTYPERYALLPKSFLSPHFKVLPLLTDLSSCVKALETADETIEGLVFKSSTSTGFSDTSIVRCRKR